MNSAKYENGKVIFLTDKDKEDKDFLKNVKGKVMFVSFMGSFQVGKSFKIAKLLKTDKIKIGNGRDEETQGVYIYGPISFNFIKGFKTQSEKKKIAKFSSLTQKDLMVLIQVNQQKKTSF